MPNAGSQPTQVAIAALNRKRIRKWLAPATRRNTALALALAAADVLIFAVLLAATVLVIPLALKLTLGAAAGFWIGRLFILGHDACHQSFTTHRRLNAVLGRLLFLPSMTPYSLWDVGHNVVHHGYTNLKGFDFVWAPLSVDEFRRLPRWRRALERVYRSGLAPGLYYLIEMWWLRMYFPSRRYLPSRRRIFLWDCLLVTGFAVAWIGALLAAAAATAQPAWQLLMAGFVLPFLFWNWMIGLVTYVHHTHPAIVWYRDKALWARAQAYLTTTVHVKFRSRLGIDWGAAMHHIFEYAAHHVDMLIPLYRLRQAQGILEQRLPRYVQVHWFSWRWYFATVRSCKLYDFTSRRWLDFTGCATTVPAPV